MRLARTLLLWLLIACSALSFSSSAQAANYITSVGVQCFSISMSNAASKTATISAVGSGAFIVYDGFTTAVSGNPAQSYVYLQLTNSTTVTATRNTSNFVTPTVKGCVVDGDTTNLIKSIQQGTITITAGTSNTATVSAVTDGNTAVHFMGSSTTSSSMAYDANLARVSLSGTTVTAATAASGTNTVAYEIIEFQGGALTANGVQRLSAASSSSVTSYTGSITSVKTANAFSLWGGSTVGTDTTASNKVNMYGSLTNGTTFTININTASTDAKTYNVSIPEFIAAVFNQAVQRGTTTLTGATSNTSTITSVNTTYAVPTFLDETATATAGNLQQDATDVVLTNAPTITVAKNTSTNNTTTSWEVPEFCANGSSCAAVASSNSLNAIWFGSEF